MDGCSGKQHRRERGDLEPRRGGHVNGGSILQRPAGGRKAYQEFTDHGTTVVMLMSFMAAMSSA